VAATASHPIVPTSADAQVSPERTTRPVKQKITARVFLKKLYRELLADRVDDAGAMMAYYAVLALFPMLIFVVLLALLVLPEPVIAQGMHMALEAVPRTSQALITEQLTRLIANAQTGFAITTAAIALWGASRGANALGNALNGMFKIEETRSWIRRQLLALAVTIGIAVMLVLALALLVIGPWLGHWATDRFGLGNVFDVVWSIGRWAGAAVLVMIVWGVVFRYLPNTNQRFRIFSPGAIVGIAAWLGISRAFGFYLDHWASYQSTYGALGSGIAFLTWLWLSNIALLVGAEINDVLAELRGERLQGGQNATAR
jgi:membrane protein